MSTESKDIQNEHQNSVMADNNSKNNSESNNSNDNKNKAESNNPKKSKKRGTRSNKFSRRDYDSANKKMCLEGGNGTRKNNKKRSFQVKVRDTVHNGSFAHKEMQKLFPHIYLPPTPTPVAPATDDDENNKDAKNTNITNNTDQSDGDKKVSEVARNPKKTVALLIGFLGSKYRGMQMNQDSNTIQAQIELALFRAGFISKNNFGFPQKYAWSNSARVSFLPFEIIIITMLYLSLPINLKTTTLHTFFLLHLDR